MQNIRPTKQSLSFWNENINKNIILKHMWYSSVTCQRMFTIEISDCVLLNKMLNVTLLKGWVLFEKGFEIF